MDNATKIWAYLNNELSNDDREKFKAELLTSVELHEAFEFYQNLQLASDVFGVHGIKEQLESTWAVENKKKYTIKIWRYAAIVLLLIIAGVVFWLQYFQHPKNLLGDPIKYAQLLKKQKQLHRRNHIAALDTEISQRRSGFSKDVTFPKLDTLIATHNKVLFHWNSQSLKGKILELEIFTKSSQSTKQYIRLPQDKDTFSVQLAPQFYYWRLNIKGEETVGFGRFYVVKAPKVP